MPTQPPPEALLEQHCSVEMELTRERDNLQLLFEVGNALSSQLELRDLFATISSCIRRIMRHDYAGLSLYDAELRQFRLYALAFQQIVELKNKLAEEKDYLEDKIRTEYHYDEMVGERPAWKAVLGQIETVAPTDATVLVLGETGTGKELVAQAIHDRSLRRDRTLVKLSYAALPAGLLESELFGYEKGAFTCALNRRLGQRCSRW